MAILDLKVLKGQNRYINLWKIHQKKPLNKVLKLICLIIFAELQYKKNKYWKFHFVSRVSDPHWFVCRLQKADLHLAGVL
jgi:hypothetical protein